MVLLQDKKKVFFVSTINSVKTCNGEEENKGKLVLNKNCNKHMGDVNKNDPLIGNYSSCWNTLNW